LTETKIALAAAVILGAAGAAEASTMDQAFSMAQASTELGATGRLAQTPLLLNGRAWERHPA
jgi:hypothetical protein